MPSQEAPTSRTRLILLAAALAACSGDGLTVAISVDRAALAPGDTVRFTSLVTNRGRAPVALGRGCGPAADVTVTAPSGRPRSAVADLLTGGEVRGFFICLPTDAHRAEPGETDTVSIAWRAPAERGAYAAVATVYRGDTIAGRSAPVRFTVR